ncbi:MAG TPA: hypothetical protein VES65_00475 [Solirubrobacteraceae bacterium]|nr:hypothetical protein [Solirubrobacteraceae bacterium]
MSRLRRGKADGTAEWKGPYAPYDLVKELFVALGVITLLVVVLTVLFSSPDDKPSTIAQWSRQMPANFATTAVSELDGTSGTAEYGPPYNHAAEGQHVAFVYLQKWLGVSHPINTADSYVIEPLQTIPNDPALKSALAQYKAASAAQQKKWAEAYAKALEKATASGGALTVAPGEYGPVATMMSSLLGLAQSGGLDGDLLTSRQFFQTDYTKPLLLMADGGLLEERAQGQHLLGEQWGMMNETGSYPGQVWLWLYTAWYQIEPFKASENADILVVLVMSVLSLAFICIPFLPGIRSIPRWLPVYKLIWREHYRAAGAPPPTLSPPPQTG